LHQLRDSDHLAEPAILNQLTNCSKNGGKHRSSSHHGNCGCQSGWNNFFFSF
jgi:hypothetical protein